MKIGIGITTRNRKEVYETCIKQIAEYTTDYILYTYEDNSDVPYTDNCGTERIGVAKAKNKCLEYLYGQDCTHIFLFDDDCFPKDHKWTDKFINSGFPHLNFIPIKGLNVNILHTIGNVIITDMVFGCLLYFDVEKLGEVYFNDEFKIYGYEHCELTERIYRTCKQQYKYISLSDVTDYIYSYDYHMKWANELPEHHNSETAFRSSIDADEYKELVEANEKIYHNLVK
jgi:hypothetical protein